MSVSVLCLRVKLCLCVCSSNPSPFLGVQRILVTMYAAAVGLAIHCKKSCFTQLQDYFYQNIEIERSINDYEMMKRNLATIASSQGANSDILYPLCFS